MSKLKQIIRSISAFLLVAGVAGTMSLAPVSAATRTTATVRPSMTLHYVYNCHSTPTVEADFYNVSGVKDVYAQTDNGIWLVAKDFNFDTTKVYDGLYHMNGFYQVDMYVTAPGAGPYTENRSPEKSVPAPACTDYNDVPYVTPTPPAGSVPIEFSYIQWWPNN
jgi:hypothetical protein